MNEPTEPPALLIAPTRGLRALDLGELWSYRELLYFLTWRDVKVRYKQTLLGASWAIIQPLLMMVVFSVFLGRVIQVPSDGVPYPVFVYAGLVPWTLFSQSLAGASRSVVDSTDLVTKVYFPRIVLPLGAVGSHLVDFVLTMLILVIMMLAYGIAPSAALGWLPVMTLFTLTAAVAAGLWLSALNVRYRDVEYAMPFLVQLWLFATPVAYPSSLVPDRLQPLLGLNPMTGVVEGFRWALLGTPRSDLLLVPSIAVTIVALIGGLVYFRQTERTFADRI